MPRFRTSICRAILPCVCLVVGVGESPASSLWLPSVWSDGAVIQQQKPVKVWGLACPSAEVEVALVREDDERDGESVVVVADSDGTWRAELTPREASCDRYVLQVRCVDEKIRLHDLLFGDVWLSGGQSNMALQVQFILGADDLLAAARHPTLRIFHQATTSDRMRANASERPLFDVEEGRWLPATTADNVRACSGIAYTFARAIHASLERSGRSIPVAVINTAVGASSISQWISAETTRQEPQLAALYPAMWRTGSCLTGYQRSCFQATALYNHKIAPLAPFGLRGVIWLQGESDAGRGESGAAFYRIALKTLIEDWRRAFEQDDLPFLIPLLHPHAHTVRRSEPERLESLAFFREAQLDVAGEVPHVAAIPTHDVPLTWREAGNPFAYESPVHPLEKKLVGERLALAARAMVYGDEMEHLGPLCHRVERVGSSMRLEFRQCPGGLGLREGTRALSGFAVCGADRVFVPGHASIVGRDTVTVWAESISEPVAVAYAFTAMNQDANLVNAAGLPAPPFRSDRVPSTFLRVFPPQEYRTQTD